MNLNCQNVLKMTEAQLRSYKSDVSLQEATPQELHEALSQAVMMSISENWTKQQAQPHPRPEGSLLFCRISHWPPGVQQPL